jgi:hypothetical protein
VPGFLFLGASKIYFDLRIKQKRRELRSSLGSMLGLNKYERICNPDKFLRSKAGVSMLGLN